MAVTLKKLPPAATLEGGNCKVTLIKLLKLNPRLFGFHDTFHRLPPPRKEG
jgi:hypothetical protein